MRMLPLFIAFLVVLPSYASANGKTVSNKKIKLACPKGIKPSKALVKVTVSRGAPEKVGSYVGYSKSQDVKVVNTTDQCYKILYCSFVYLVDRKHAIFRVSPMVASSIAPVHDVLLLIDFGNGFVKYRTFNGIVKGIGSWEYKDEEGIPRKIPHVIVVKEFKP